MAKSGSDRSTPGSAAHSRKARLAEALRANLKRRKAQARDRRSADESGGAGEGGKARAPADDGERS